MNPTNPNGDSSTENNQEQSGAGEAAAAPRAASERDVQEAERKGEEAYAHADDAHDALEATDEALREEIAELRATVEDLRGLHATHAVSLQFLFENASSRRLGKSLPAYEVPALLEGPVSKLKEQAGEEDGPVEGE